MVTLVVVISALVNKSYGQNKKKTKTKNTYKNRSGGWWHFVGTLNENCRFCRDNLRGKLVSMLSAKKKNGYDLFYSYHGIGTFIQFSFI